MLTLYTGGTFDVPHIGHYNFLRQCKYFFPHSKLIVSLNTDDFILEFKHKLPIFSFDERKSLIEKIEFVDEVIENIGGRDSKPAILSVKTDIVIIGSDWLDKNYLKQMDFDRKWLEENNIALIYIPYTELVSTTEIKRRLNAR